MVNLSILKIKEITGGVVRGTDEGTVSEIIIDSRKFFTPDDTLFVALKGDRHDGHEYIPELLKKGMRMFIVEDDPPFELPTDTSIIIVHDSLNALQQIAAFKRQQFKGRILAITGSNGKTIIKEWINQALAAEEKIVRSPQSYNSRVGVPLSLFQLRDGYDLAIIEAGISRPREMDKLREMIQPDIGIMTNIGEAHQENFDSYRDKAIEKLKLFKHCEKLIYCADYSVIHELATQAFAPAKLVSWGGSGEFDYYVTREVSLEGSEIHLEGKVSSILKTPFRDLASIENAIHLIVFLYERGYTTNFIRECVINLEPVNLRMQILKGANRCTLINDSYNSDLVSLTNALDFFDLQDQHKRKSLLISDILQSGFPDKELYQRVAKMINKRKIERVIAVGERISAWREYFPENSLFYRDTRELLADLPSLKFQDEAVLLKAARKFEFELVSAQLQESAHRTVLEIDLSALLDNYRYYKSLLAPGTGIMAMVKAFSYGSGGFEIANLLQYQNVEYLAVAFAHEGVSLRKSGIKTPVMVMSPEKNDFDLVINFNLEPEIYSLRVLREFKNFIKRSGISLYPIHIKMDSGMGRLGFIHEEIDLLTEELKDSGLKVISVFSHLAAADDPEEDDFTLEQIRRFSDFADDLEKRTGEHFLRHIANTSGIERFPSAHFDMVRLGIGLYGVSKVSENNIREVSSFKTRISQVRKYKSDSSIGYNRAGKASENSEIATLPVGYADGIPRNLSQGVGKFMINHHIVPVTGNVCMDMCMVDVTGTGAKEGDEVIIFGKDHSVNNMARDAKTIAYEILTGISRRVKRIYYQE